MAMTHIDAIVDAVAKLDARIDAFDKKTQKWRVAVRGEGERKYQKIREEYHSKESHERRRVVTDPNVHDKVFENGRMIYGAGRAWDDVADAIEDLSKRADALSGPEHEIVIQYSGDFQFSDFIEHLRRLGSIGASRDVVAMDENDKPIKFEWDGDGADKIWSATIDGKDILK